MAGELATIAMDGVNRSYIIGISRFARNDMQERVIPGHVIARNEVTKQSPREDFSRTKKGIYLRQFFRISKERRRSACMPKQDSLF